MGGWGGGVGGWGWGCKVERLGTGYKQGVGAGLGGPGGGGPTPPPARGGGGGGGCRGGWGVVVVGLQVTCLVGWSSCRTEVPCPQRRNTHAMWCACPCPPHPPHLRTPPPPPALPLPPPLLLSPFQSDAVALLDRLGAQYEADHEKDLKV